MKKPNPTPSSPEARPAKNPAAPSHDAITQRARELWEKQGRPVGRDEEIWLEAESQLNGGATVERDMETGAPGNFSARTKKTKPEDTGARKSPRTIIFQDRAAAHRRSRQSPGTGASRSRDPGPLQIRVTLFRAEHIADLIDDKASPRIAKLRPGDLDRRLVETG